MTYTDTEEYEIEGEIYHEGQEFVIEDNDGEEKKVIFKGVIDDNDEKDYLEDGLYYSLEDDEFINIENHKTSEILDLLKDEKSVSTKRYVEQPQMNEDNAYVTSSNGSRYLYFCIKSTDDVIVKCLKQKINERKLTSSDVKNYNLIYGLRDRSSVRFQTVEEWCKILNLEIKFDLVPKIKF